LAGFVIGSAKAVAKDGSTSFGNGRQRGIVGTRLAGKIATITGGSRGQGAATAKPFFTTGSDLGQSRGGDFGRRLRGQRLAVLPSLDSPQEHDGAC
jgi:hypothetical protein